MPETFDLVIRAASVFDGSGAPPVDGDIGLRGSRIAALGDIEPGSGPELDAHGLALSPGFIDVHSHDDLAVFLWPEMDFKVMQGVTTDIVGNCGMGAAPGSEARSNVAAFDPDGEIPHWTGYASYIEAIEADPPSLNVAVLMGHGTARNVAMGNAERAPDPAERKEMRDLFTEGMAAGAVGMSTGLIYEPGRYSSTEELVDLARLVGEGGGLYASHMRNEGERLLESIAETLLIGREGELRVQISHHKASGRENWGKVRESLRMIDEARADGMEVSADQYPYTAGSTLLYALVQNGAVGGSGDGGVGTVEPEGLLIASASRHPEYEGKTLADLADAFDLPAEDAANRVLEEAGRNVWAIIETMSEDDVRTVMGHPSTMIGSDGIPAKGANPHPRLYGTFPRVLGRYARDEEILPLAEAVHRMTGMPAHQFRLADRGVIREGAIADLVLFDPATVADRGTYDDPRQYPAGIPHVFVNGTAVVRDGVHTGARPGEVARMDAR